MLTMIVAYVIVAVTSCIALFPMFMAGVAYSQGATLWGVYPVFALVWFIMFSDWLGTKLSSATSGEDDDDEDDEEVD